MRILKVVLGIGVAIGFGALAQTAGLTSSSSALPRSGSQATPQYTATDQSNLGTGGSGDAGTKPHKGKPVADAGMK
jgi:hypothetical protein